MSVIKILTDDQKTVANFYEHALCTMSIILMEKPEVIEAMLNQCEDLKHPGNEPHEAKFINDLEEFIRAAMVNAIKYEADNGNV